MVRSIGRRLGRVWSLALAIPILGWWLLEIWLGDAADRPEVATVVAVIVVGAFATLAWWPFTGAMATLAGLAVLVAVDPTGLFDADATGVLILILACVLGSLCDTRERIVGLLAILFGTLALALRISDDALAAADVVNRPVWAIANMIAFTIAWGVAWMIAGRVRANRVLRAHAASSSGRAEERARAAVAEERAPDRPRAPRRGRPLRQRDGRFRPAACGGCSTPTSPREREALAHDRGDRPARRSPRCAGWSACCARATRARRSSRSRGSRSSTRWSPRSRDAGPPGRAVRRG